jgi:serine/threonine-protein kinase
VVVDYIGRGGHSLVYKARHKLIPGRFVALKTFDARSLHNEEGALVRFRQELDIVSRLDHPNVVRAYDVAQRRNELFLVLEYVDGCDLAKLVAKFGAVPIGDAVGYALQAARALAYAHRCGVVHRDVKPANLLLARNGVIKLADLGLAQFLSHEDRDGKPTCLGTPEFMAPEQARNSDRVDARSDLYSLGATLYHLLTGQHLVSGATYLHKLKQLLNLPLRPLGEARPETPPGLAQLVDRLRSRDPDERPASAEEVLVLLKPFARRTTADHEPRYWDGRRKAALVLEVLQGRLSRAQACAPYDLSAEEFEQWQRRFLEGAADALDPSNSFVADYRATLQNLYAKIGAQALEIETLKASRQLALRDSVECGV